MLLLPELSFLVRIPDFTTNTGLYTLCLLAPFQMVNFIPPILFSTLLSRPVLSDPVLSSPVLFCPILPCPFLSCTFLSCSLQSSPIPSDPLWSSMILSNTLQSSSILSDPLLFSLIISDTFWYSPIHYNNLQFYRLLSNPLWSSLILYNTLQYSLINQPCIIILQSKHECTKTYSLFNLNKFQPWPPKKKLILGELPNQKSTMVTKNPPRAPKTSRIDNANS